MHQFGLPPLCPGLPRLLEPEMLPLFLWPTDCHIVQPMNVKPLAKVLSSLP